MAAAWLEKLLSSKESPPALLSRAAVPASSIIVPAAKTAAQKQKETAVHREYERERGRKRESNRVVELTEIVAELLLCSEIKDNQI